MPDYGQPIENDLNFSSLLDFFRDKGKKENSHTPSRHQTQNPNQNVRSMPTPGTPEWNQAVQDESKKKAIDIENAKDDPKTDDTQTVTRTKKGGFVVIPTEKPSPKKITHGPGPYDFPKGTVEKSLLKLMKEGEDDDTFAWRGEDDEDDVDASLEDRMKGDEQTYDRDEAIGFPTIPTDYLDVADDEQHWRHESPHNRPKRVNIVDEGSAPAWQEQGGLPMTDTKTGVEGFPEISGEPHSDIPGKWPKLTVPSKQAYERDEGKATPKSYQPKGGPEYMGRGNVKNSLLKLMKEGDLEKNIPAAVKEGYQMARDKDESEYADPIGKVPDSPRGENLGERVGYGAGQVVNVAAKGAEGAKKLFAGGAESRAETGKAVKNYFQPPDTYVRPSRPGIGEPARELPYDFKTPKEQAMLDAKHASRTRSRLNQKINEYMPQVHAGKNREKGPMELSVKNSLLKLMKADEWQEPDLTGHDDSAMDEYLQHSEQGGKTHPYNHLKALNRMANGKYHLEPRYHGEDEMPDADDMDIHEFDSEYLDPERMGVDISFGEGREGIGERGGRNTPGLGRLNPRQNSAIDDMESGWSHMGDSVKQLQGHHGLGLKAPEAPKSDVENSLLKLMKADEEPKQDPSWVQRIKQSPPTAEDVAGTTPYVPALAREGGITGEIEEIGTGTHGGTTISSDRDQGGNPPPLGTGKHVFADRRFKTQDQQEEDAEGIDHFAADERAKGNRAALGSSYGDWKTRIHENSVEKSLLKLMKGGDEQELNPMEDPPKENKESQALVADGDSTRPKSEVGTNDKMFKKAEGPEPSGSSMGSEKAKRWAKIQRNVQAKRANQSRQDTLPGFSEPPEEEPDTPDQLEHTLLKVMAGGMSEDDWDELLRMRNDPASFSEESATNVHDRLARESGGTQPSEEPIPAHALPGFAEAGSDAPDALGQREKHVKNPGHYGNEVGKPDVYENAVMKALLKLTKRETPQREVFNFPSDTPETRIDAPIRPDPTQPETHPEQLQREAEAKLNRHTRGGRESGAMGRRLPNYVSDQKFSGGAPERRKTPIGKTDDMEKGGSFWGGSRQEMVPKPLPKTEQPWGRQENEASKDAGIDKRIERLLTDKRITGRGPKLGNLGDTRGQRKKSVENSLVKLMKEGEITADRVGMTKKNALKTLDKAGAAGAMASMAAPKAAPPSAFQESGSQEAQGLDSGVDVGRMLQYGSYQQAGGAADLASKAPGAAMDVGIGAAKLGGRAASAVASGIGNLFGGGKNKSGGGQPDTSQMTSEEKYPEAFQNWMNTPKAPETTPNSTPSSQASSVPKDMKGGEWSPGFGPAPKPQSVSGSSSNPIKSTKK